MLISSDGQTAAVRTADGRLGLLHSGRDNFALKEWLAADADGRDVKHATLSDGVRSDAIGCAATLKDGRPVTMALVTEALAEDCTGAAVVISPHEAYRPCGALLVDRKICVRAARRPCAGQARASRPAARFRPAMGARTSRRWRRTPTARDDAEAGD